MLVGVVVLRGERVPVNEAVMLADGVPECELLAVCVTLLEGVRVTELDAVPDSELEEVCVRLLEGV